MQTDNRSAGLTPEDNPSNSEEVKGLATSARSQEGGFAIGSRVLFGSVVIGALVFVVGAWAATAELTGAIIAPGSVVVEKNVKKVQHRDGGIVSEIHVKNGDHVKAGQVMVVLDDTQIKSELAVVSGQLTELTARKARLDAEVEGREQITFPEGFLQSSSQAKVVADGERRLFEDGKQNTQSQKQQLALRITQLEEEIEGVEAQLAAKQQQLEIIQKELAKLRRLYAKKLTSVTRLYSLEREESRLRGEHGGLVAQKARTRGKISEIRVQILAIDHDAKLQSQRERRNSEAKIFELREREIAAADRLKRTKLFAPQSGIVHELAVHTIGGVVSAAETVVVIVPAGEKLTIEARFSPVDIDQVIVGRQARLRFSAFNQRTTPEVQGRVAQISADVSKDPNSPQQYYVGRIEMDAKSKEELKGLDLLPGMPVEVFVSTGARTALTYLTKPITDQFNRAFREE